MAKKKKRATKPKKRASTKGKAKKQQLKQPSYFKRQIVAVVLLILAIFIGMGAFGIGGSLPVVLFDWTSWLFGFVAFVIPLILIFLAVHKLRHEEFLIPIKQLLSSVLLLIALAGMLHVSVDPVDSSAAAAAGSWGGQVGHLVSVLFLNFLNSITAIIVLLLITLVALMLMLDISPRDLYRRTIDSFKREDDTDLEDIAGEEANKPVSSNFKLKENVPVETDDDRKEKEELSSRPRKAKLNPVAPVVAAAPLAIKDNHSALLEEADPNWKSPPISLLSGKQEKADPGDVKGNAERIKQALGTFGVDVEMEGANISSRVTQYTMSAAKGVKMSKIVGLADNIAYELEAHTVRIEAPIPGKKAIGIEVPNKKSANVTLRSLLNKPHWQKHTKPLVFAVGQDISGDPVYADLAEMPHVLIAGQTKSGKSVMINTLLTSLLYRNSPADLKLIMVDPKFVELEPYNDIPHLLTPVINENEKCISALKWSVAEMEHRYKVLSGNKVRNIEDYNENQEEKMPHIIIVIDELSDLMQAAGRDVEALIVRIAQKARAVGIHLVLATQRPSVDVITGLIKANVPARMAFTVTSQIDSRTIIDQMGAEKLLGMGDMLFTTPEIAKPKRIQGAFISTAETNKVTDYLRDQQEPKYNDDIVSLPVQLNGKGGIVPDTGSAGPSGGSGDEEMFKDAVAVVVDSKKASTSMLQRRLRIGYGRASRIMDEMEEQGIIGPADGSRPRDVLISSVAEAFGGVELPAGEDDDTPVSDDPRDELIT